MTILFSFAASGLIGIVIHKICYEKFFESARYIPWICTIGMSMLIKNTVQILFGSETKAMPEVIPLGGIQIGNYRITYVQCTVMVVVTVLCILLSLFLNKTKQGVILRAVSQDRKAAAMVGIDVGGATLMGNVLGALDTQLGGDASVPYVVGGRSNLLHYPEYSDVEKARNFLAVLESRDKLAPLLRNNGVEFTVRIGPENKMPEFSDCSVITATYRVGDNTAGTMGIIGPTRMNYARVVSVMNYMGRAISDMLSGEKE